jgi:hypothetical protein
MSGVVTRGRGRRAGAVPAVPAVPAVVPMQQAVPAVPVVVPMQQAVPAVVPMQQAVPAVVPMQQAVPAVAPMQRTCTWVDVIIDCAVVSVLLFIVQYLYNMYNFTTMIKTGLAYADNILSVDMYLHIVPLLNTTIRSLGFHWVGFVLHPLAWILVFAYKKLSTRQAIDYTIVCVFIALAWITWCVYWDFVQAKRQMEDRKPWGMQDMIQRYIYNFVRGMFSQVPLHWREESVKNMTTTAAQDSNGSTWWFKRK